MQNHFEASTSLKTSAQKAFEFLDDPRQLSSHMSKSSWMIAGSRMDIKTDAKHGQEIGSEIILEGKMMGIPLFVREKVVTRAPPYNKIWQTIGPQKMIIIDQYQMGFELIPQLEGVLLRVFIDYELPIAGFSRILALLAAKTYARWCTRAMLDGATRNLN